MGKSRLKAKKYLVLMLAVILAGITVATSSFSWFTRPGTVAGKSLSYALPYASNENMVAYDGSSVTMQTYKSTDEGITWTTTAANPDTTGTLTPKSRVYYKTVLTNNSTQSPQNVSLYIKNLNTGSTGECCVGVNVPIKAFKNYSHYGTVKPSPSKTSKTGQNTKRIYFQPNTQTNWTGGSYYVRWTDANGNPDDGGSTGWVQFTKIGSGENGTSTYYADIGENANKLFISVADYNNTDYKRTQTFTNLTGDGLTKKQSLLFTLNGTYTSYNNAYATVNTCTGANILNYYNTATLGVQDQINLQLPADAYSGTLTYSLTAGNSNASLSSSTVTGVAAGSATLRFRSTSQFGDYRDYSCSITVKSYTGSAHLIKNAPIVTNLLIDAKNASDPNDKKNVQEVYWFIQNGDEMYVVPTDNVNYSLSGIYLGV